MEAGGARGPEGQMVVVHGEGEAWQEVDQARFSVEVSVVHATSVHRARETAARVTTRLLEQLKEVLEREPGRGSCRTAGVSIHQEHKHIPGQGSQPAGFRVSNTVAVCLRVPELAAEIIDAAVEASGEHLRNLSGPNFGVSQDKMQEAEQEAFKLAMHHAYCKAAMLAREGGRRLGPVLRIEDSGDSSGPCSAPMPARLMASARGATATPVESGDGQAVRRGVTVTYRFEPPPGP